MTDNLMAIIDTACDLSSFYYRRCCRVHKLVPFVPIGRCGLCREVPLLPATVEEYLAQPPLEPEV